MQVQDVMTRDVRSCSEAASARDALEEMWKFDIGALPIVDSSKRVLGMVTDRDIAMATYHQGAAPHHIRLADVASGTVWSVGPKDSVEYAERTMEQHQVRRLPVVSGTRLVGIITLSDLARARPGVLPDEVARTLAAITTPRNMAHPTA